MCCAFRGMCCLQAHVQNALTLVYMNARTLLLTISTHTEKKTHLKLRSTLKIANIYALHCIFYLKIQPHLWYVCLCSFTILIIFKVIKLLFFFFKSTQDMFTPDFCSVPIIGYPLHFFERVYRFVSVFFSCFQMTLRKCLRNQTRNATADS